MNRQFQGRGYRDVVISVLTYVRVGTGWNYIGILVDLYNREIIGYSAGKVLQHSEERMYKSVRISDGGGIIPDRGGIRLCYLQPCAHTQL